MVEIPAVVARKRSPLTSSSLLLSPEFRRRLPGRSLFSGTAALLDPTSLCDEGAGTNEADFLHRLAAPGALPAFDEDVPSGHKSTSEASNKGTLHPSHLQISKFAIPVAIPECQWPCVRIFRPFKYTARSRLSSAIELDIANGVIRVERGWDALEGEIPLKTRAGRRKVPISAILRDFLAEHLARVDREPSDRITLHECRHTFASLMIAAGVNAKALQTFMGHANVLDHPRPLRATDTRVRGRGCGSARRLSRGRAQAPGGGCESGRIGADWRTKWRTGGERVRETALECWFPYPHPGCTSSSCSASPRTCRDGFQ